MLSQIAWPIIVFRHWIPGPMFFLSAVNYTHGKWLPGWYPANEITHNLGGICQRYPHQINYPLPPGLLKIFRHWQGVLCFSISIFHDSASICCLWYQLSIIFSIISSIRPSSQGSDLGRPSSSLASYHQNRNISGYKNHKFEQLC